MKKNTKKKTSKKELEALLEPHPHRIIVDLLSTANLAMLATEIRHLDGVFQCYGDPSHKDYIGFDKPEWLKELLLAGEKMSNICFNLGQEGNTSNELKDQYKLSMREAYEAWDKAKKNIP